MRKRVIGTALAATTLLAVAGQTAATAAVAPPINVASLPQAETPGVVVDAKGTVLLTYSTIGGKPDQFGQRYDYVRIARKPKGAKKFTPATLPGETTNEEPYLFEPSKGVLELLVTGNGGSDPVKAWKSTDDGVKWTSMDTSALNDPSLRAAGIYISTYSLSDAPGGPIMYAGSTGDPAGQVVQFNDALTKVTTLATNSQTLYLPQYGRTTGGVTFQVGVTGASGPTVYGFEVDGTGGTTHTGLLHFPTCKTGEDQNFSLAVGAHAAVVTQSSCGHVWSKTISTSGAIGKTVKIATGPTSGEWTNVVADTRHHFTAAFARPGGDTGIAHSTNGTKWSTNSRSLPTAVEFAFGFVGSLSHGSATWLGYDEETDSNHLAAMPVTNTYRAPKAPSASGIPHAKRELLGSLAATVPGVISATKFRPHGRTVVRLVGAVAGKYTVGVTVDRVTKSQQLQICYGQASHRLTPGHPVTVTLTCSGGGVVIGGTASSRVGVKKGDRVTFTIAGRNGTLTVVSKIA